MRKRAFFTPMPAIYIGLFVGIAVFIFSIVYCYVQRNHQNNDIQANFDCTQEEIVSDTTK